MVKIVTSVFKHAGMCATPMSSSMFICRLCILIYLLLVFDGRWTKLFCRLYLQEDAQSVFKSVDGGRLQSFTPPPAFKEVF